MGTSQTFEKKLNFMKTLLKRKDLSNKAKILKEFCLTQLCTMGTAREFYNLAQ